MWLFVTYVSLNFFWSFWYFSYSIHSAHPMMEKYLHSLSPCWARWGLFNNKYSPQWMNAYRNRLNVCAPSKFICWNLVHNVRVFGGGAFGRWLGHKDGALMNGVSALIKETPESSLAPYTMWGHSKKRAIYEPGSGPWSGIKSAFALILDFPRLQNCKKQISVVYMPPSLWYFVIAAQTD